LDDAVIPGAQDAANDGGAGQFFLAGRFDDPLVGRDVGRAIGALQINPQQNLLA
jgi:hypothetical protein